MRAEEAQELIEDWLEKNAERTTEEWICRRCGSRLMGKGNRVSIHEDYSQFGTHAGMGKTREIIIPYCPKCETEPNIRIICLDY